MALPFARYGRAELAVAILGLGRTGTAIGYLLRQAGYPIVAVTCRSWSSLRDRIRYTGGKAFAAEANAEAARAEVGDEKFRIWRIYLAGSAHAFDRGWLSLFQLLKYFPGPLEPVATMTLPTSTFFSSCAPPSPCVRMVAM